MKLLKYSFFLSLAINIFMLTCTTGDHSNPCDPNDSNCQGARIITNPESVSITEGQSASFSVKTKGTNVNYQWQKNSINIPNANSATYTIPAANNSDGGSYRCIVWNDCRSVNLPNRGQHLLNAALIGALRPTLRLRLFSTSFSLISYRPETGRL